MAKKRLSFAVKEAMVSLAGTCFWFWNSFYSFLDSAGVSRRLYLRYPKESGKYQVMRNVITDLENAGEADTLNSVVSNFYRLRSAVDRDHVDQEKAKTLLSEFRSLVGDDPIQAELRRRKQEQNRKEAKRKVEAVATNHRQLAQLNEQFVEMCKLAESTPQQRGFALEKLFFELLRISEFEYSVPYRTNSGEQIDGHFNFAKFDYLVESKWLQGQVKQPDVAVFDSKIRGKAQSTRGLFVSMGGVDENVVLKFSGDSPRIMFMNGEDLALILNGTFTLFDALKAKVDALVRYGRIYLPLREV